MGILRLSALGDACHTLPVVRTLQEHWPKTRFTWITGGLEAQLLEGIDGVELVRFDKGAGRSGYRALRERFRGRRFDVLLHMQNSMRGNLASLCVRAPLRVGFDRRQSKDQQWLFTNRKIPYLERGHVMDVLFGFATWCGARERVLRWDIPVPDAAQERVEALLGSLEPFAVLSPCANPRFRNWRDWTVDGYARVVEWLTQAGLRVVLSGGPSTRERELADAITERSACAPLDLVGRTSLKELLALLSRAELLVAPDSGPAHMATAMGTPVVGLFATTNPERARPYLSEAFTVNRYPEAAEAAFGRPYGEVEFGRRVRDPEAMARITPEHVFEKLDRLLTTIRTQATP